MYGAISESEYMDPNSHMKLNLFSPLAACILAACLVSQSAEAGLRDVYWAPTQISNAVMWLDAADEATLWADTNGTVQATAAVARWDDKSGNGNHMLQADSNYRPVTGSRAISNINAIAFDGSNDRMQEAANAFGASISNAFAVMVFERDGVDYRGDGYIQLEFDTWECCSWGWDNPDAMFRFWANGASTGIRKYTNSIPGSIPLQGRAAMLGLYASQSDNVVQVWVDAVKGVEVASVAPVNTTAGIQIAKVQESGTYFDGLIAEVVVIDGTVTTEERQTLEGYLAWKWDFVYRLPDDHPYKEEPPNNPPAGMIIVIK